MIDPLKSKIKDLEMSIDLISIKETQTIKHQDEVNHKLQGLELRNP